MVLTEKKLDLIFLACRLAQYCRQSIWRNANTKMPAHKMAILSMAVLTPVGLEEANLLTMSAKMKYERGVDKPTATLQTIPIMNKQTSEMVAYLRSRWYLIRIEDLSLQNH